MIRPPFLERGDTVGIVASGRKVSKENIEPAIKILEHWGVTVKLASNLFSNKHPYLAGIDQERLNDLQVFLDDPEIKIIFCARGGYGTTRIVDQLDFKIFASRPKWVVGFSDVTALHLKLSKLNIESIHGTMPILFDKQDAPYSVCALRKLLFEGPIPIQAAGNTKNVEGKASGKIVGGNLSLVIDSLGTSSEIDTRDSILVLEEIDEYKYRLDRMFVQLRRAGKFHQLKGLVLGHFTDIKESELNFQESVEDITLNQTKGFSFPIGFNFPIGHENPNLPWCHGSLMNLDVTKKSSSLMPIVSSI